MKAPNMIGKFALVAILVTGALVVVPGAEAQLAQQCGTAIKAQLATDFTPPSQPIKPIIGTHVIPVKITYSAPQNAASLTPVTVDLSVSAEDSSWATVSISPASQDIQLGNDGQPTSEPINANVIVALNAQAPAFGTQNINLKVTATDGSCVLAPEDKNEKILISAGFYERYQAQFDQAVWKTSQNDQIQIPLTVINLGNGPIEVRPLIDTEGTSKQLDVAPPAQITIPTTIGGGDRDRETVNIEVQTPFKNGYVNERHKLFINLEGNSADDKTIKLTGLQLAAVVQTQGVYVPGFSVVSLFAAAAVALGLARRSL